MAKPARPMEDRMAAVMAWIITGNTEAASEMCAIPARTIRDWTLTAWWGDAVAEARRRRQDELDSVMTGIINMATKQAMSRLQKGDEVMGKNGEISTKAVSAKDCALITAIFVDKRAVIRGDGMVRVERKDAQARLKELKTALETHGEPEDVEVLTTAGSVH